MSFLSCAWMWMYVGAAIMLLELAAPGFVLFFFGLSAMTVGLCRFAFGDAFTATWQFAAFSAFAILYIVTLRRWLKRIFNGDVEKSGADFTNEQVGRLGRVTTAIEPPLTGRVVVGDAEWSASADRALAEGTCVKVVSRDNLTLKVDEA